MENDNKFLWERFILTSFAIIQVFLCFTILQDLYNNSSLNRAGNGFLLYKLGACLCMILLCVELYYSLKTFLTKNIQEKFVLQGKAWEFLFIAGFFYFITNFCICRKLGDDIWDSILSGILPFGAIVSMFGVYIFEKNAFFEKL